MESAANPRRLNDIQRRLAQHGQQHLLTFWDELDDRQRDRLVADIESLDFDLLDRLIESHVRRKPEVHIPDRIAPPVIMPNRPTGELVRLYADARKAGETLIAQGKVAAFIVAGGQGTRLGYDGPKGTLPVSVVRGKTLFQLFAEFIRGTRARYGAAVAWYVMTSPENDAATREFFATHGHFGLPAGDVIFFQQGQMPAFSPDGKLLLAEKDRLALSPDGHGGCLMAMRRSGALDDMRRRGVEHVSYFQVDNPLVAPIDPLFLGLHHLQESEMSSKTIPKAEDKERVGNFCIAEGRTAVIEYSDLPDALATARNPDGSRRFNAASIAIHALRVDFIERLTAGGLRLPWHRADKKVACIDPATGARIDPQQPNGVKLETFVFDAIPLAGAKSGHPLIYETRRDEEFSPIKNRTGIDSLETSRRDMNRRAARWLEAAGFGIPRGPDGEPDGLFEIDPSFAQEADHVRRQAAGRARDLPAGTSFYLSADE